MQSASTIHSDTESRLLDAAEAVFAARGFHAASTSAIARLAGVNKTLIHYYFRSKEGLHKAILLRMALQLAPFLEDLSIADPIAALSAATRRYVRLLADHPHYVRLCAYGALEGTGVVGDEELHRKLVDAACTAIQRGVAQGIFRPEDPRHVLTSVEGMCRFFFEHEEVVRRQWDQDYSRDRLIEERSDHIVRMLLHGLRPDVDASPEGGNRP